MTVVLSVLWATAVGLLSGYLMDVLPPEIAGTLIIVTLVFGTGAFIYLLGLTWMSLEDYLDRRKYRRLYRRLR